MVKQTSVTEQNQEEQSSIQYDVVLSIIKVNTCGGYRVSFIIIKHMFGAQVSEPLNKRVHAMCLLLQCLIRSYE